jgi:hypothetical protein
MNLPLCLRVSRSGVLFGRVLGNERREQGAQVVDSALSRPATEMTLLRKLEPRNTLQLEQGVISFMRSAACAIGGGNTPLDKV